MSILEDIFAHKRLEVAAAKQALPMTELENRLKETPAPADFAAALRDQSTPAPRLIAEVKHRSPSKGVLCKDFDPLRLARIYVENGAAAISVLTDEKYFGGSLDDLRQIADLALGTPLLRKDFIFDRYQLLEARAAGASAILLIASMLSVTKLADLIATARNLQLTPLVEVHTRSELEAALQAGAAVIGINNRNLHDFSVNLKITLSLRPQIPAGVIVIAESGIYTPEDIACMEKANLDAVLVGEALVTAPNVAARVRGLTRVGVP